MADSISMPTPFNPAHHLTDLRGRAYLEVKWRLVWVHDYVELHGYRLELETEHIEMLADYASFRARVRILDENGMLIKSATGYGTEHAADFGDFTEKAETKALGRALAACGFGTQFAGEEYDFGAETSGRVVDSPVQRPAGSQQPSSRPARNAVVTSIRTSGQQTGNASDTLTPRQYGYLETLLNELQQKGQDVSGHFAILATLSRATASSWVDQITKQRTLPELPKVTQAVTGN